MFPQLLVSTPFASHSRELHPCLLYLDPILTPFQYCTYVPVSIASLFNSWQYNAYEDALVDDFGIFFTSLSRSIPIIYD